MLYFRSPAVENDLPLAPSLRAGCMPAHQRMAMPEFAVSGLAPSTVLETARGVVRARDLRIGDRVITRDHGLQPLRWVGTSTVMYADPEDEATGHGPVRIRAGAFGTTPESGNLVLAPGQRVLVRNPMNATLFGADEVMAAAGDLTHLDGVSLVPRSVGRWTHVLFDNHEMIRANGLWVESFAPNLWSIRAAYPAEWEEITEAMPRLRYDSARASYVEARMSLDPREARILQTF